MSRTTNKSKSASSSRKSGSSRVVSSKGVRAGGAKAVKISQRFKSVRVGFSLNQPAMARVLGVSQRKLSELENDARQPRTETKRRLTEVERLHKALAELMGESDLAGWMEEPNEAFDNATPLQVIERGEIDRLWQMIYAVRSGHPI